MPKGNTQIYLSKSKKDDLESFDRPGWFGE